jgi:hypothetical protein
VRRIVANLDFEEELRAAFGGSGGRAGAPSAYPYRPLSGPARRAAAAAGARLAAFARPGDRLWLPGALPDGGPEETTVPEGVEIEGGELAALPPADQVLAWGESPRVADLRGALRGAALRGARDFGRGTGRGGRGARDFGGGAGDALALPLHQALWWLPAPEPGVVARVAHRRFAFELARERGWAPPGAGFAADPAQVEALARAVSAASGGPWVAKAPWSAAGRERVLGAEAADAREPGIVRRLESLLERHGSLLVEPWVERTADFGCAGRLAPSGARLDSVHGLEVDRRGAFRGTVPLPNELVPLAAAERAVLEEAFHAAAEALAAAGYTGPFGVDAFRWRRPDGDRRESLRPLVEINPRLTFGLVAAAEAEGTGRERSGARKHPPGGSDR